MEISSCERRSPGQDGFDPAQAALVASGVDSRKKLDYYLDQLARLAEETALETPQGQELLRAQVLFQRLWQAKPHRYQAGGEFRLNRVINAQIDPKKDRVGNCLGLTLLYNVLGQKLGLKLGAVHLEEAFGLRPHVFSLLHAGGKTIDVENVLPQGFDYRGHGANQHRVEWTDKELVADIYLSQGNRWFDRDRLELAIRCYNKAIRLNPAYERAHLNKGMALARLGRPNEAGESLGQQPKRPEPETGP